MKCENVCNDERVTQQLKFLINKNMEKLIKQAITRNKLLEVS